MRNRQGKGSANPSDFVLTTDDEKTTRAKHRPIHLVLLIGAASLYLVHTVRAYVPFAVRKHFNATNSLVELLNARPITRVYTADFRPNFVIENLLLRIAENWQVSRTNERRRNERTLAQAFWLIYVLSFIPRRTQFGYVYRLPDVVNVRCCLMLIGALLCQWSSQLAQTSEVRGRGSSSSKTSRWI